MEEKNILEKEHQMKMESEMEGETKNMCNLSDLIEERAIAKETVQSVTNLMENLQLSLEKACEALGKTVEEFQAAKEKIGS